MSYVVEALPDVVKGPCPVNPIKIIIIAVVGAVAGVIVSALVLNALNLDTKAAVNGGICGGVGAAIATFAASRKGPE